MSEISARPPIDVFGFIGRYGTLLALGTFAIGFIARPIGGLVFGHFGDRIGRKKLLVLVEKGEVVGREPDIVRPDPERFASVVLTPDSATLDDCNALWKMAGENLVAAGPPLTVIGSATLHL